MRYVWPSFLLFATLLAPNRVTAIILLCGGLLGLSLSLIREQKIRRFTDELSDVLAIKRKTSSIALERSLSSMQRQMIALTIVSQAIVFTALLIGVLDITVARNYALLILIALTPLGLELALFGLLRSRQHRGSETVRTAVGYAAEDARALLLVIGLSFVATVTLNIPAALSAMQMLFITCVVRPLLSGRALQALPHKRDQLLRVGLTAFITYGSFLFFFIRHYYEPRFADATNVLVWQATTVSMLAFIACQAALLILTATKVPLKRLLALLSILVAIICVPVLQPVFGTALPMTDDIVWIILAGSVYVAIYLLRYRPFRA